MDRHGGLALTRLAGGVLSGTDAWSREARRVRERATHLGLALDEEELALQDVHDLQALHTRLQRARAGPVALHHAPDTAREQTMFPPRREVTTGIWLPSCSPPASW